MNHWLVCPLVRQLLLLQCILFWSVVAVPKTSSYLRDWTSVDATLALAVDLAAVVLIKLPPGVTKASAWPVKAATASAAVAACTDRTIDLDPEEQIPSGLPQRYNQLLPLGVVTQPKARVRLWRCRSFYRSVTPDWCSLFCFCELVRKHTAYKVPL